MRITLSNRGSELSDSVLDCILEFIRDTQYPDRYQSYSNALEDNHFHSSIVPKTL